MNSKVYFTREITPEKVVELYHALGVQLPGKVAVKVHSGEKGNQNFLRPEFWRPMVEEVHGTVVECNTAYGDATAGVRDHTEAHRKLLEEHGWTKYFDVDLMEMWSGPSPTARSSRRTTWARTSSTMTPCWCWPTSRGTPWAATAGL